ncbi:MAG: hypothetical protein JXR58_06560 [Bacteroidales bacterium]|nr:hypothetical protein [Bacteroidales bacterium]
MELKFRLVSSDSDEFFRDIAMKETHTFADFHFAIQDACNYDKSQMTSFFIADENWERGFEIPLMKMQDEDISMDECKLGDFLKKPKDRLIYVFDFFSNRAFYLELFGTTEETKGKKYPYLISERGDAPKQICIEDVSINDILDEDLDAIYGEETRSGEDLDDYNLFTNIDEVEEGEDY